MRTIWIPAAVLALAAGAWFAGVATGGRFKAPVEIKLSVTPAGACIYMDGRFLGCSREGGISLTGVSPGQHLLRVTSPGYLSVHRVVTLGAAPGNLAITLRKQPTASLDVYSTPAGATVILDGHVRGCTPLKLAGLKPGSHTVEVAKVNYRTRVQGVELAAGENKEIRSKLRHRQVLAYRARIRRDPGDIQAYNDLGELLYVLKRYPEAADTFVRGFVATGKYGKRDEPNRRNTGKLRREARGKHPLPAFQQAFFKAVVKSVQAGEVSPLLLNELKSIPYNVLRKERIQALSKLVAKHPDEPLYRFTLMEQHLFYREFASFISDVESFLKRKSRNPADYTRLWELLSNAYNRSGGNERQRLLAVSKQVLALAEPLFKNGPRAGQYLHEQSRIAAIEGRKDLQRQYLEQALKTGTRGRMANAWRVELARLYLQAGMLQPARQHLTKAAADKDRRDPNVRRAARMLREVKRREERERKLRDAMERRRRLDEKRKDTDKPHPTQAARP